MTLVMFNGKNDRAIWINPDRVVSIREDDDGEGTKISFDFETWAEVKEDPQEVVNLLLLGL